jgi:hypothetical protein
MDSTVLDWIVLIGLYCIGLDRIVLYCCTVLDSMGARCPIDVS